MTSPPPRSSAPLLKLAAALLKPALTAMSRRRLPQVDGRLHLDGLQDAVTIDRDRWGIPHIQAQSRPDLFFAQGFVHAQDRLWQMEINRRTGNGRLAEILGAPGLEVDRLSRTLGFRRLAEATWTMAGDQLQADAEAYAAGVNAYLALERPLPVEFSLLRFRPQPWRPLDSVAFGRVLLWALSYGWAGELVRARLIERLGPETAAELEPSYPERNPVTLPDGVAFNRLDADGMLRAAVGPLLGGPFMGKGRLDGGGRGSNGWVVAASRSATGSAILCNDMHLPLTSPSLWYFWRLDGPDLSVSGVSQPGLPYVLVGHNAHIAWGATLAFTDGEDLFIERFHPDDPPSGNGRYQFGDEWRQAQVFPERIPVRGGPDHVEQVVVTHHGPVISPLLGVDETLSLCAVALQPDRAFEGFAALNAAADWDEFVTAVALIDSPPLNLLYADTADNIGYWVSGKVPVRAKGQGLVPAPGHTADHEWIGVIPFEEMPHAFNPARGVIVSANHRIVGDDYRRYLGSGWMNGYRARRLETLLAEQERISLDDCRRFQFDLHCIPGLELVERLAGLDPDAADARLSLDLLRKWDGRLDAGSVGGSVYKVLLARLAEVILGGALGEDLAAFFGQGPHEILYPINEWYGYWPATVLRLLDDPGTRWLAGETGREAVLERCLAETTAVLRRRLGSDPARWRWGRLHHLTFDHVLAAQPPLDRVFNQGPFSLGGDTNTVLQTAVAPGGDFDDIHFSVSYRQIIDLGDLASAQAMFAPGQSGQLASPHYGDLIAPWSDGRYFPMDAGAAGVRRTLMLRPSSD